MYLFNISDNIMANYLVKMMKFPLISWIQPFQVQKIDDHDIIKLMQVIRMPHLSFSRSQK